MQHFADIARLRIPDTLIGLSKVRTHNGYYMLWFDFQHILYISTCCKS